MLPSNNKSRETLILLEWEQIVRIISSYANLSSAKKELEKHPIVKDFETINASMDGLSSITALPETSFDSLVTNLRAITFDYDAMQFISKFDKGHVASTNELHIVATIISVYYNIEKLTHKTSTILNYRIVNDVKSILLNKLVKEIRLLVSEHGEHHYENHPEVRKIQDAIFSKRASILGKISELKGHSLYKESLQFEEFDILYDRFVLAIRSDSYTKKHGSVVGRSKSGQTLFIEPHAVKDDNSEYGVLLANREEILNRICVRLSEICHDYHQVITRQFEYLIDIDILVAKAKFTKNYSLTRPTITKDFSLKLLGFFHPLIEGPVHNDILINENQSGIIISGPNTGGKTVILKTVALAQLFIHYGLFVPAQSATLSPINSLYYFSNDQQDLSQNLSSFAAESVNYLTMLSNLTTDGLIIIDEIFNSTSSEEASALAIGLIDYIQKNSSAKLIISTHHHILKSLIFQRKDFISGHVGYNLETNRPTYKLMLDGPGSSMAFTIFKKLSHMFGPALSIANDAEEILDKKQISYEELLGQLSQKQAQIDRELRVNRQLQLELKNQKDSMHGLLTLEKSQLYAEYKSKLDKVLSSAHELVANIKRNEKISAKTFSKKSSGIKGSFNELNESPKQDCNNEVISKNLVPAKSILINHKYYSTMVNSVVTVISVDNKKGQAKVVKGNIQILAPLNSLYETGNKANSQPRITVTTKIDREASIEIDCRGMRLDEFKNVITRAIDDVLRWEVPFVNIIHGHGDGILKNYLREQLRTIDGIKGESKDGNDGSTKITND